MKSFIHEALRAYQFARPYGIHKYMLYLDALQNFHVFHAINEINKNLSQTNKNIARAANTNIREMVFGRDGDSERASTYVWMSQP